MNKMKNNNYLLRKKNTSMDTYLRTVLKYRRKYFFQLLRNTHKVFSVKRSFIHTLIVLSKFDILLIQNTDARIEVAVGYLPYDPRFSLEFQLPYGRRFSLSFQLPPLM